MFPLRFDGLELVELGLALRRRASAVNAFAVSLSVPDFGMFAMYDSPARSAGLEGIDEDAPLNSAMLMRLRAGGSLGACA
jgi:hypothetical protein